MASLLSYALTDLASVKESLNIASSVTTYDNLIIRKINQATEAIEHYCNRRFASTTYTHEEYNATQIDQLVLYQRPVTTFTSLEVRNSGLNADSWETIDSELYFVDTTAGVLDLMFSAKGRWKRFRANYVAGFSTIPADLAEACVSLAAYYVNNADGNIQVKNKQEGSRKIEYYEGIKNFYELLQQLGIDQILDGYCNNPVTTDR